MSEHETTTPRGVDPMTGFALPCPGELGKRIARLNGFSYALTTLSRTVLALAIAKDTEGDDNTLAELWSPCNLVGLLTALALLANGSSEAVEWFDEEASDGRLMLARKQA